MNEKELSIWYFCDAVKVILQTVESIAVQAMLFNDQEKTLNYPAINQWMKLMNGKSIRLVLLPCVNECWLGTASKNHWNYPDNNHTFPVSHAKLILGQLWGTTLSTQVPQVKPGHL